MIKRPEPTATQPQHLCLDKGYDYEAVRETLEAWGYTAHIRCRGEEVQARRAIPAYRARRWVVERTHADEPLSAAAHPVGEEGGELSRAVAFGVCRDYLSSR